MFWYWVAWVVGLLMGVALAGWAYPSMHPVAGEFVGEPQEGYSTYWEQEVAEIDPPPGLAEEAQMWYPPEVARFYRVLALVGSGGNNQAVGDGGRSIGMYQVGQLYWEDGLAQLTREGHMVTPMMANWRVGAYHPEVAELVIGAYMRRYAPDRWRTLEGAEARSTLDRAAEEMARIHNGGPHGHQKKATEQYGRRFMAMWEKDCKAEKGGK